MKKDFDAGTKMSGSWQAVCRQRSRRGFVVSQNKSTHPRASRALCSAPASDGGGGVGGVCVSNSMKLWWLGRGHNKGRAIFEQRLMVLFG